MFSGFCLMKSDRKYADFLSSLKEGDKVGVQVFHPKGDSILDFKHQYWMIYEGEWTTGRVRYDGDSHPIRTDGRLCYWNSEEPHGSVFPSRIVQWCDEFAPRLSKHEQIYLSDTFIKSERPVYEPLWSRQSFFLDGYGPSHGSVRKSVRADKYPGVLTHSWRVHDGTMIQVFDCGDYDFSQVPGYLYSEDCSE